MNDNPSRRGMAMIDREPLKPRQHRAQTRPSGVARGRGRLQPSSGACRLAVRDGTAHHRRSGARIWGMSDQPEHAPTVLWMTAHGTAQPIRRGRTLWTRSRPRSWPPCQR
jgi:hypothetical protein